MTATTDTPTVRPEVPAWLNLDAVVQPDYIERVGAALRYAKRNVDVIRETAMAVRMWSWEFEEAVKDLPEDVYAAVEDATGVSELRRLGFAISALFEAANEGKSTPDDVLEELDAIETQLQEEGIEPTEVAPDLYDTVHAAAQGKEVRS